MLLSLYTYCIRLPIHIILHSHKDFDKQFLRSSDAHCRNIFSHQLHLYWMWNCGCGGGRAGDHQRTISPKWGQLPSQVVQIQYNPNPNTIQNNTNTIQTKSKYNKKQYKSKYIHLHKFKYSALNHNKHTFSKPQHKYKTHYYTIINNFDMYTLKFVLITGQVICVNQKIFT